MKEYNIENLRNVGIIGHSASGKTALTEALLYYSNTIDRLGKVDEGTTVSDYDQEEKRRGISLTTSIIPLEWKNIKINLIDTPGYFDFIGESIEGIRASDIAMIVVCGLAGVQVGTEKAWEYCNKINLPRAFFINKLDRENSDYKKVLNQLKSTFGVSVVPIHYPIGKEREFKGVINVISGEATIYDKNSKSIKVIDIPEELIDEVNECKQMITEAVAETDEVLLDKYFSEGELSTEEIYNGLISGCTSGEIVPVLCGSAMEVIGLENLLEVIKNCFPCPKLGIKQKAIKMDSNESITVSYDEYKPFSAFVFKTIADPFVGKLSIFRVITGELNSDINIVNSTKGKLEKMGALYYLRGKNQIPTKKITAGDIGAVTKLQYTSTGDTLCEGNFNIAYNNIKFPSPVISMAVLPISKGDEEKISSGLNKLLEEDPTFTINRDVENAETIVSGIGEIHLEVIASKLKNKFGIDMMMQFPKVPYRETIKSVADVQGKHKKQSGGHGQYGDVKIRFEPRNDGIIDLDFNDKIVGGVVPKNFIPAVEKGLRESIKKGVLAGYPVIGIKATLHDGSYHPVDSSEMAFKIAASIAYKKGIEEAKPILLEPIMKLEVVIPDEYMGDVIGDINKKRGKVIGMEPERNQQRVIAEVPMAEMFKYATDLRSITQARGSFVMKFERYDEVPHNETVKIIERIKGSED